MKETLLGLLRDVVVGIISVVVLPVILGGGKSIIDYVQDNWLLVGVLFVSMSLNTHAIFSWRPQTIKTNPYRVSMVPFHTLIDHVEEELTKFNPSETSISSLYLIHWLPTFSLSRGMNLNTEEVLPSESNVYIKYRQLIQETRGRIICFNGKGIYRFIVDSELLYENSNIVSTYLEEVIQLLADDRITYSLIPWGMFPFTLLVMGDYYATFDFTSLADLQESRGHKQSSRRSTLRLETHDRNEIRRIRRNSFDTLFSNTAENDEFLLKKSISYLRLVRNYIKEHNEILSPEMAEEMFWGENKNGS